MKRRTRRNGDEQEMQMEPMVDVVFLLLVFFLFTFQVRLMEQLYLVEVPGTAKAAELPTEEPLRVGLQATPTGGLAAIVMETEQYRSVEQFQEALEAQAARQGIDATKVSLKPASRLKYRHVVEVAMAVRRSGLIVNLLAADATDAMSPNRPEDQSDGSH